MFNVGDEVMILRDMADGARVSAGQIGIVMEHPVTSPYKHFVAVQFKKPCYGEYGSHGAVISAHNLKRMYRDEEMFEDGIRKT